MINELREGTLRNHRTTYDPTGEVDVSLAYWIEYERQVMSNNEYTDSDRRDAQTDCGWLNVVVDWTCEFIRK